MRDRAGFTLIELLVALTVFSLAAMALINLSGENTRAAGRIETKALAAVVAENRAVEALTSDRPPPLGVANGVEQAGMRTWRWSRKVAATGDPDILRIDIVVLDPATPRPASVLTVFRSVR
ncbi:type II secretion system minor pseudopilin GspI [Caulobacter sp. NIBR1757]|uniref:type II secretion system minor pseudopilin GspI n=1 Tax=Caulobacter sp. NIBR1757 TaxID=3016000 RepID=UPI0022F0555F|nr:type II secretion system minor pseudopilin GspI [Caulobacter sp. NIBR1757]WGM37648.1 Type II secretion system protein I [Caulobacter sp. NIBR1757]